MDLDTNCEVVWVTIKIQGTKDLTIGSFYRSHTFGNTPEYLNALRESLEKIKKSNKGQIILGGDFNLPSVDWDRSDVRSGGSYANLSRQMLDIANDFNLEQVVREPTRKNNILDLLFTSNPTLVERSWVVPVLSDHDGIPVVIISTKPKYIKVNPRKIFMYQKADVDGLKKHLKSWSDNFVSNHSANTDSNVNSLYEEFQNSVEEGMELYIPSKTISKRNISPWINKKIKRLQKRKQRAYNSHKRLNTSASYDQFNSVRKETHKISRAAYRNYIKQTCSESSKKFYSFIKSLKIDTIGIPALLRNGSLESDNKTKAEILNDQFCSVFTQEHPEVPVEPESNIPPMPNITIYVDGVLKLLKDLNPNKSSGPDEIPARLLKLAAEELAPALSLIFQKSLDSGEVPNSWLQANITPLFKKGDRTIASNYRPVSLTSICSKLLEHIIHSNIMKHFNKHSILTDKQHGFRQKHSCESQLILTVNDLAKSLDNKSQVDMIIMDFSKAFDVVPHNRLISKLHRYGLHGTTLTWISGFLKHRTQRVVVSGEKSAWSNVISGVPQGTVLGPLLFLVYINDLPDNLHSSVRLFADDCVIYREIKNDLDSELLQEDLHTLGQWEKKWQMRFNTQKCFVMRLTHSKPKMYQYSLGGEVLSPVENHSYLGVSISNKLNWNGHIHETCSKANRSLGFIKRNFYSCTQSTKLMAYKSFVRPLTEYSSAVWDPYTKKNINKLESVQKRAARFILNDYKSKTPGCATQMVKDLKLEPLATRRKIRRLCIFHQARHGHLSLPIGNFLQPVQRQSSRHHHPDSYNTITTNKDCFKFSFVPQTILDWNSLPSHIATIPDPENFKVAVTTFFNETKETSLQE